ncbi:positive regulator of sigma(E), RseC/MucC [Tissierella creatinophila DSM 6911]|uniref:Positive regulator of sigma(E), RseC/MucC n=1 Tax=Tissierella creatinophila DSM 6911 TaxID=1123403 RepID=A0A1U7M354_TISCR|nr:positive regulator of sigma(E), RseC/MucC [Tissierella creatinophila DSM 6911]
MIPNDLDAKVGDFVEVKAEISSLLKYTFILYMIPFIFLIGGIFIGNFLFRNVNIDSREILSFLSGIVSVMISLLILKFMDKRVEKRDDEAIKATRIL